MNGAFSVTKKAWVAGKLCVGVFVLSSKRRYYNCKFLSIIGYKKSNQTTVFIAGADIRELNT